MPASVRCDVFPRLYLWVANGASIKPQHVLRKNAPYVKLSQAGQFSRTVASKGQDPVWNQLIFLDLCSTARDVKLEVLSGSALVGAVLIPPRLYNDGRLSRFRTVTLRKKGKRMGAANGLIKVRWQLQYPNSAIRPPTEASRAAFDVFRGNAPPPLRLFATVYGARNFRKGKKRGDIQLFCEVRVGEASLTLAAASNAAPKPVWNRLCAAPVFMDASTAKRCGAKQFAPSRVDVRVFHKTWRGTKLDGATTIPFERLSGGSPVDAWWPLSLDGQRAGDLRIRLQLQRNDSLIVAPRDSDARPTTRRRGRTAASRPEAQARHRPASRPEAQAHHRRARSAEAGRQLFARSHSDLLQGGNATAVQPRAEAQASPPLPLSPSAREFLAGMQDTGMGQSDLLRLFQESKGTPVAGAGADGFFPSLLPSPSARPRTAAQEGAARTPANGTQQQPQPPPYSTLAPAPRRRDSRPPAYTAPPTAAPAGGDWLDQFLAPAAKGECGTAFSAAAVAQFLAPAAAQGDCAIAAAAAAAEQGGPVLPSAPIVSAESFRRIAEQGDPVLPSAPIVSAESFQRIMGGPRPHGGGGGGAAVPVATAAWEATALE